MKTTQRWAQRFENFTKAFKKLQEITQEAKKRTLSSFEEQGLVQAFEFTYETAWLTLKDYLSFQGHTRLADPRDTIREAFKTGLIEDGEGWMAMMESRNQTVHTYNEEIASEVMKEVLERYVALFAHLEKTLPLRHHD